MAEWQESRAIEQDPEAREKWLKRELALADEKWLKRERRMARRREREGVKTADEQPAEQGMVGSSGAAEVPAAGVG